MKKIKTAERYTQWFFKNPEFTPVYRNPTDITKLVEKVQIEMLEYAVNKCLSNAYAEESRIGYVWEVNEQSILKTIDEIKKELENSTE